MSQAPFDDGFDPTHNPLLRRPDYETQTELSPEDQAEMKRRALAVQAREAAAPGYTTGQGIDETGRARDVRAAWQASRAGMEKTPGLVEERSDALDLPPGWNDPTSPNYTGSYSPDYQGPRYGPHATPDTRTYRPSRSTNPYYTGLSPYAPSIMPQNSAQTTALLQMLQQAQTKAPEAQFRTDAPVDTGMRSGPAPADGAPSSFAGQKATMDAANRNRAMERTSGSIRSKLADREALMRLMSRGTSR